MKSRLFRFRDRASYKASEVLALFVLSMFLGMFFFAVCAAVDYGIRTIFGEPTPAVAMPERPGHR